jgi:hypothetical protein
MVGVQSMPEIYRVASHSSMVQARNGVHSGGA